MNTDQMTSSGFKDVEVDVKVKLSALWVTLMFLYVYVDIFSFYKPGTVENILVGKVWEFDITQTWALSALILMTIPSVMIFLSLVVKPSVNRWINIIVALFYILVSAGNAVGETWSYYYAGAAVEVILLALIVWFAWKWPRQ